MVRKLNKYKGVRPLLSVKVTSGFNIPEHVPVTVTTTGNITEVQYLEKRNRKQVIQLLPGLEEYVTLSDGEIHDVTHHETRKELVKGLYKTFARLRALVNSNVVDVSCVRWCTLTYRENMTDPERLYKDFHNFNLRLSRWCTRNNIAKYEYIVVMEPQARGAWHAHLLLFWAGKAPYIANKTLADLWGHGFVSIKALAIVDNVGAYLTAYLGDIETSSPSVGDNIKEVVIPSEDGKPIKKKFIKGGRLHLYPVGFQIYRHSKGIKEPIVEEMTYSDAKEKISSAKLTFSRCYEISDSDTDFRNVVCKEYYNSLRK